MSFETVVSEVKDRLETVGTHAQDVAQISLQTLKQANKIVVTSAQDLFKTNIDTIKIVFDATKTSFEKALTDGLKALAADPISYIPDSRDTIVTAFNETVGTVTKTGEKLAKVIKSGYENVSATLNGETAKPARTVRKTVRKATATAKKAAA
jgi:hypothetical protein